MRCALICSNNELNMPFGVHPSLHATSSGYSVAGSPGPSDLNRPYARNDPYSHSNLPNQRITNQPHPPPRFTQPHEATRVSSPKSAFVRPHSWDGGGSGSSSAIEPDLPYGAMPHLDINESPFSTARVAAPEFHYGALTPLNLTASSLVGEPAHSSTFRGAELEPPRGATSPLDLNRVALASSSTSAPMLAGQLQQQAQRPAPVWADERRAPFRATATSRPFCVLGNPGTIGEGRRISLEEAKHSPPE
jgi:hypothetical protein